MTFEQLYATQQEESIRMDEHNESRPDVRKLTFGSLFAGIGGLDLGLERAGMVCKWQVEIDDYAKKVLEKHWPDVPRFLDVEQFNPDRWHQVDGICGGFPCQGTSNAGLRKGLDDERSGLWREFIRIAKLLLQMGLKFLLVENVGSLTVRGLQQILGDLHQSGFDAEWSTYPASAFGFPHQRERLFILAYPTGLRLEGRYATEGIMQKPASSLDHTYHRPPISEPFGLRTTDGIPGYVDRIRCLGNAVVPQVAEFIGRAIVQNVFDFEGAR